jgi:hypothetical protein
MSVYGWSAIACLVVCIVSGIICFVLHVKYDAMKGQGNVPIWVEIAGGWSAIIFGLSFFGLMMFGAAADTGV